MNWFTKPLLTIRVEGREVDEIGRHALFRLGARDVANRF
jgi:hypothetical protein